MPSARLQYLTALAYATLIVQRCGVGFKRLFIDPSGKRSTARKPSLSTRKRNQSVGSKTAMESHWPGHSRGDFDATSVLDNRLRRSAHDDRPGMTLLTCSVFS